MCSELANLLCQTSIPPIIFLGKELFVAHTVKDLGVIVDKNLSFDEHINVLASDLINKLVMLSRIRHLFDQQSLFIIINSLIFTKLFYCATVWSGTSKTNIHKLQLVQNFSGRIFSGKRKFKRITLTLKDLNLLRVSDLLLIRDALLMYKCMNNFAPDYLTCLFKKRSSIHQHNTRNSKNLDIPKCRTAKAQNSFSYRGVSIWNSLPWEILNSPSVFIFKIKLKSYYFDRWLHPWSLVFFPFFLLYIIISFFIFFYIRVILSSLRIVNWV